MSATYTLPWAGTRDYLRFLAGDTDASNPFFQDEELDGALLQWGGDARMAAAEVLENIAGLYARNAISYSISGFSLNRAQTHQALLERAKALRDAAKTVPFEFESVVDDAFDTAGTDWSNYIRTGPNGNWPPP